VDLWTRRYEPAVVTGGPQSPVSACPAWAGLRSPP